METKKSAQQIHKVSDFPNFHHYVYGASSQNSAETHGSAGKTEIPSHIVPHVKKAEAELTGKTKKQLLNLGADADEGEDNGLKHAPRALEKLLY